MTHREGSTRMCHSATRRVLEVDNECVVKCVSTLFPAKTSVSKCFTDKVPTSRTEVLPLRSASCYTASLVPLLIFANAHHNNDRFCVLALSAYAYVTWLSPVSNHGCSAAI